MGQGFLLRKDDYPDGLKTSGDVERLAALLNPYLTAINALSGDAGVSLSGNVSCEVQIATLSHGVASGFSLKKLSSAKGCLILGCDKAIPKGVALQPVQTTVAGSLPRVSVTVWFDNPRATSIKVALLFLPEGQLSTQPLSILAKSSAQFVSGNTSPVNIIPATGWTNLGSATPSISHTAGLAGRRVSASFSGFSSIASAQMAYRVLRDGAAVDVGPIGFFYNTATQHQQWTFTQIAPPLADSVAHSYQLQVQVFTVGATFSQDTNDSIALVVEDFG